MRMGNTKEVVAPTAVWKNNNMWKKRVMLILEIALFIISGLLLLFGIKLQNQMIQGFCSTCFTALLVTLLSTIVNWHTDAETERYRKTIESQQNNLSDHLCIVEKLERDLRDGLNTYDGKACVFCRSYIKGIKENRESCDLTSFFNAAKREISILATNLESIVPYQQVLNRIAKENPTIKVRILTMHPDFAKQFNISRVTGETSLMDRWRQMRTALLNFLGVGYCYTVKTYKGIAPTLILFISDDSCYVSHLLNGKHSRNTTHFLFQDDNNSGSSCMESPVKSFKEHFEHVWNDEATVECCYDDINNLVW